MIFSYYFPFIIPFFYWNVLELQSISIGWQSTIILSNNGLEFVPIDEEALLLFKINTSSIQSCTKICHSTVHCRIFDYDDQTDRCRIFEGDIITMGSIVISSFSHSYVGLIQLDSEHFIHHGRSCSFCEGSRYLICINSTCQCQANTFFNGLICQSQKFVGAKCNNVKECRLDRNYTCLPRKQCGPTSLQNGITVGGYGNGTAGNDLTALNYPWGIGIGIDESIYVSDYNNNRVIKLQEGSLVGTTIAGTGIAGNSAGQLKIPLDLFVDSSSNIYVVDNDNYRVMLWRKNATVGIKVAGSGSQGSTASTFREPNGITVDSMGNVYVSDFTTHRVMKWAVNATFGTMVAGTGVSGNSTDQVYQPAGLYFDEIKSYLYIADASNHRIQRYYLGSTINITTVAGGYGLGTGNQQLNTPYSVCVSKKTGDIYIADTFNNRIQRWSPGATSGVTIVGSGGLGSNSTMLNAPRGIALNYNETYLYVTDYNNHRVQRFKLI
uniref:Apple domain-containing protein n=1 Tax=Adineta vaga TaxID=104782 RepID=B3G4G6_ADIVA|nr:NHL repeat containing hypothetical protein RRC374-like protein [Adineta vaga]